MRIRSLFVSGVAVIAVISLCIAGALAYGQWHRYAAAHEAQRDTPVVAALLRAVERLSIERGNMVVRMTVPTPMDDTIAERIAGVSRATDAALAGAITALRALPGGAGEAASLEAYARNLAEWRETVRAAARRPASERPPGIAATVAPRFGEGLSLVEASFARLRAKVARESPDLEPLLALAQMAWDLREAGSRRIVAVSGAVSSGRRLTAAELETIATASGSMDTLWRRARASVAALGAPPRLAAALETVDARYFRDAAVRTAALVAAGREGNAYPMTIDEMTAFSTPTLQQLLLLRDAAMDEAAARAADSARQAFLGFLLALGAALLLGALLLSAALLLDRRVIAPIVALTATVGRLAAGERALEVPGHGRRDEIGAMAGAIEVLRDRAAEADRATAQAAAEQAARAERASRVEALARSFEGQVEAALGSVGKAVAELDASASAMAQAAAEGRERAIAVSGAATEASANVQTVAGSAEEMAASIAEVSRQVSESARIARRATEDARATDAAVGGLSEAASRIGDVVRLINDIAGQTSLLALNATIEAARAGEAGKGFAVVASEVKALAAQTAKATEQIGGQIATMQAETSRAVEAIGAIGRTIDAMTGITTQVATAAEQQSAATREISRAVAEAASGTEGVSHHATAVSVGAETTGEVAARLRSASADLAREASHLRGTVDGFLQDLRAA